MPAWCEGAQRTEASRTYILFIFSLKPGRLPAHQTVFLILIPLGLPSGLACLGRMRKSSVIITNLWSLAVVGSIPCLVEYGELVFLFPGHCSTSLPISRNGIVPLHLWKPLFLGRKIWVRFNFRLTACWNLHITSLRMPLKINYFNGAQLEMFRNMDRSRTVTLQNRPSVLPTLGLLDLPSQFDTTKPVFCWLCRGRTGCSGTTGGCHAPWCKSIAGGLGGSNSLALL